MQMRAMRYHLSLYVNVSMLGVCVCLLLYTSQIYELEAKNFMFSPFIFLLNLFLALLGGGKGLRMDHEALSWRAIKTKNQQAAVICKSEKLLAKVYFEICFCHPSPADHPLFWRYKRGRNLYILSQLYSHSL
jgi:hypothetical protein